MALVQSENALLSGHKTVMFACSYSTCGSAYFPVIVIKSNWRVWTSGSFEAGFPFSICYFIMSEVPISRTAATTSVFSVSSSSVCLRQHFCFFIPCCLLYTHTLTHTLNRWKQLPCCSLCSLNTVCSLPLWWSISSSNRGDGHKHGWH